MAIRPAQQQDAIGIAKVHVETWQSHYRGHIPDDYLDGISVEKRAAFWTNHMSKPSDDSRVFVAEEEGEIVGFCGVGVMQDNVIVGTGELYAIIYVRPDQQGKGAGKALMEAGLQFLRERGYKRAILWVLKSNTKTREFYESKGWVCDGVDKQVPKKDFVLDEIRYSIKL